MIRTNKKTLSVSGMTEENPLPHNGAVDKGSAMIMSPGTHMVVEGCTEK
jgi:hypothetical protein